MDAGEFVRVVRKDAKLSRKEISDKVLVKMFRKNIDVESKGEISIAEFLQWAKEGGEAGHNPVGGGNEEQTFLADDAGEIKFSGLQGELADLMAELKDV